MVKRHYCVKAIQKKIFNISITLSIFLIINFINILICSPITAYADTKISKVEATASSYVSPYTPLKAVDSNSAYTSRWYCTGAEKWLQLDLKEDYHIDRWVVKNLQSAGGKVGTNTRAYKLRGSMDGKNWTDVDVVNDNVENITNRKVTPFLARYVQLYIIKGNQNNNDWSSIVEFELYAAPRVSSVSIPANGTYKVGQNLDFTINFNENVNVTGISSKLSLNIGGSIKEASFMAKGANSVTYRYVVQRGDIDNDGITIEDIKLNGTTIRDSLSNDAIVKLNNIPNASAILVDALPKISVATLNGGSITATHTAAASGTTIQLSINPKEGMRLKEGTLKYNDGIDHYISGTSFIMPETDVIVSAEFEEIPVVVNPKLTVNIEGTGTVFYGEENLKNGVSKEFLLGTEVVLTAVDTEENPFMHWLDDNGKVISTLKTYTFTIGSNINITAKFRMKSDSTHLIVFKNGYGDIIQSSYVINGEDVIFPPNPSMYGYTFNGWDKTLEEIKAAKGDIVVTAKFTKNKNKIKVTVNGGTGSGEYAAKDYITVKANAPKAGKKFSHWVDLGGNIVCYDAVYRFYVVADVELTAVYVGEIDKVEQKASIAITSVTKDVVAKKISFVAERIVPDKCTIISHGIIVTNNNSYNEESFIIGANGVLNGTAKTNGLMGTYVINKGNVQIGQTWYARGYVIYKDNSGKTITVYSSIVSATMN